MKTGLSNPAWIPFRYRCSYYAVPTLESVMLELHTKHVLLQLVAFHAFRGSLQLGTPCVYRGYAAVATAVIAGIAQIW